MEKPRSYESCKTLQFSDYRCLNFTEPFMRFLELYHELRACSMRTLRPGKSLLHVCSPLLPLLRRRWLNTLNEPNPDGIFANTELLPALLKYVISNGGIVVRINPEDSNHDSGVHQYMV